MTDRNRPPGRPPHQRPGPRPPAQPQTGPQPARPRAAVAPQDKSGLVRVCGPAAVKALFDRAPDRVERLFHSAAVARHMGPWAQIMAQMRRPYRQLSDEEMAKVGGTVHHGGVVAIAQPRPAQQFDSAAALGWARTLPFLLVLDGIGNPHNLGAIVRTAAYFGLDRILVSDHPAQAGISDAAYRVAEGGMEFVQMYRATDLPAALKSLRATYRVIGTALGRPGALTEVPRSGPVALVLGNEETGLDRRTLAMCQEVLTLPGAGTIQSLNVAATAAILIADGVRRGR